MYKKVETFIIESLGTIFGCLIMACAISLFLLPNELSSGGFSGIATVLHFTLNIPVGVTMLCLNIPLFLLAGFKIGKSFFAKSLLGTVSLSLFIDYFARFEALTSDKLLSAIYGGVLVGVGTAIILKCHSSTGGSDLLSVLIKRVNNRVQTGHLIIIIDALIVFANMIILKKIEIGLYSAITIYLMGIMIDIIVEGIYFTKLLIIVSDKNEEISKEITEKIGRGSTGLYGKGMYSNTEKLVLMCAVSRKDISDVKQLIKEIDKNAFIIVTNSREVLGEGFKEQI